MTGPYRIGIDVGGTNTDAVVLSEDAELVAKAKRPTTDDVTGGIVAALDAVLAEAGIQSDQDDIGAVMLGTTHCANAVTERQGLDDVGVIRLGAPATKSIPPLFEWAGDLQAAIGDNVTVLEGGHHFDGREISALEEAAVRRTAREFADVDAFAVTGVFSPVRKDHEVRAAELIREELGDIPVSRSNEIGSVGLLERENATVLNAALGSVAREAAAAFRTATAERGIDARLYFGQNDGTLMSVEYATEYPIYTVASGPSNSVRGGATLSGVENGIIVDVGGTTTDVGAVVDGFPRESSVAVELAGIETNFRMPDLLTVGLGGGSRVLTDDGRVTISSDSVGHRLTEVSRAFGGSELTATDIAVAAGRADVGTTDPAVPQSVVADVQARIDERMADVVDRMKTAAGDVPVVAVGGGSILVPDDIAGASEVHRPDHFEVANAVGAATADISGFVDRIFSLDENTREEALELAEAAATEEAIQAGADPDTTEVVSVEEVALSYMPGNALRIRLTVAGALAPAP